MDVQTAVWTLRQPINDSDDSARKRKLQVFSYTLALLKNEQNVGVLVDALALSPGLFGLRSQAETCSYAVDAVRASAARKHRVSDPTLAPQRWEQCVLAAAYTVPPLVGLVLVAGLAAHSAHAKYAAHIVRMSNAVIQDPKLAPGLIGALSRAGLATAEAAQLSFRDLLVTTALRRVFDPQNLELSSPFVSAHLASYSSLLRVLLASAPMDSLRHYMTAARLFVRTLMARHAGFASDASAAATASEPQAQAQADSAATTSIFFAIVIQLEGVAMQVLRTREVEPVGLRYELAVGVLEVLQSLNAVAESVGTQFDSYQFVLNACLDTLVAGGASVCGHALHCLGDHWAYGQPLPASDAFVFDLVFLFEIGERLMPYLDAVQAEASVLTVARRFIVPANAAQGDVFSIPVFEASHSVMLAFLATHDELKLPKHAKRNMALQYFAEILQLFPGFLGGVQLRTAVLTVLSSLDRIDIHECLTRIFNAVKASIPGMVLGSAPAPGPEIGDAGSGIGGQMPVSSADAITRVPPTVRAALISTLLHGVSQFCVGADLSAWLELISSTVPSITSHGTLVERQYLMKDFADVATSGGDPVVLWWFKHYEGRL